MLRSRSAASHTLIPHCLFCAKGDRNPSVLPVLSNLFDMNLDICEGRIWAPRAWRESDWSDFASFPRHRTLHDTMEACKRIPVEGRTFYWQGLLWHSVYTHTHTHHQSHVFDQDLLCTSSYNRCRSYAWWFCSLGPQQLYQGLCTTNVTLLQDTSSLLCASGIAR